MPILPSVLQQGNVCTIPQQKLSHYAIWNIISKPCYLMISYWIVGIEAKAKVLQSWKQLTLHCSVEKV